MRRQLSVAGAWGYEWREGVVYVVLDETIPEDLAHRYVGLVELLVNGERSPIADT